MNDRAEGITEGLMIGLLLAEKNKKHPQRIQSEIVNLLRTVSITIAYDAIDRIATSAGVYEKTH